MDFFDGKGASDLLDKLIDERRSYFKEMAPKLMTMRSGSKEDLEDKYEEMVGLQYIKDILLAYEEAVGILHDKAFPEIVCEDEIEQRKASSDFTKGSVDELFSE
jgi:hypothetical protein